MEQKPNMKKYGNNEESVTHSGYINQRRFHKEDKRGTRVIGRAYSTALSHTWLISFLVLNLKTHVKHRVISLWAIRHFFIHFLKWLLFLPLLSFPTWLASAQECWSFPGLWHEIAVLQGLIRGGKSSTYVYDLIKGFGILKHSEFQRQIFRNPIK